MSALWSYLLITICLFYQLTADDTPLDGEEKCQKPDNVVTSAEKTLYSDGETLEVQCVTGYYPFRDTITCVKRGNDVEWDYNPPCIAQCKKPSIDNVYRLSEDKDYYKEGEKVTVRCIEGYYPSPDTMTCNNPPTWTPRTVTCIAQCTRPTIDNVYRVFMGNVYSPSTDKEYYKKGELVTVQCNPGYYPSPDTMRCTNPPRWTPLTVTCKAQCKKPTIDNVYSLSTDQEYYKKGDWVRVQCIDGYYPSSYTMTCNNPPEWTPPTITCIGVTFTDWRVTATSISTRISCTPQCPDRWRFIVQCCTEPYLNYRSCKHSYDRSVTFTDLRPSSNYRISTRLHIDQKTYSLESRVIITKDSVPGQPEILKSPSMEDNRIRWELSEKWGDITGFQMNISVRRDYNHSFSVDESLQFPPNVTEYKIPLQYGTKYTITLRGFTSAGALEVTEWITETEIGDPPCHPENTLREGFALLLYPVSDVNGPISSYEIIVYMDQDEDLGSNCIQYSNTSYNSNGNLSHYTAAVLPAETLNMPRTFILGDNHHYNGFHNVPLIPNINYTVYIRVTSRREKVEKSSCAFAGFIGALTTERTDGFFIIVLSLPSLGLIITMLILKVLALVGLAVIPLTPWMGMGNTAEKRGKKRRNISTEDVDDDEAYEVLEEAENRI